MLGKMINLALYQLGWFSCVIGAGQGFPRSGALVALLLIAIHLLLATERDAEVRLMIFAGLLGALVDSAQQALGVVTFKDDPGWPLWLPAWILIIWVQFATLFRFALHWLAGRYLLAAFFGMLGGPFAYWSGVQLGAAQFGDNLLFSVLSLALVWALVVPSLVWLSSRFKPCPGRYRGLA